MADTVCVARRIRGRRTAGATAAAFGAGVIGSSVAVLVAVAAVGGSLPWRGAAPAVVAVCVAAAIGDALGLRVRPQIPFQVPERWRHLMALPAAGLLYGLLLGTGLSSAVPAFALWALVLVTAALGHVTPALSAGLALGLGRSVTVAAGGRLAAGARGLRLARAAAACAVAGAALAFATGSSAATPFAGSATDPSAAGGDLAWEEPGVGGFLLRADGTQQQLPGHYPAVGGSLIAWFDGSTVTVADRATLTPRFDEQIVGVRQLAVSDTWLALRQVQPDGTWRLIAQSIADTSVHSVVAEARPPATLGRPALFGSTLVFARASGAESSIVAIDLDARKTHVLRSSSTSLLLNPTLDADGLLYVQVARCAQWLRLGGTAAARGRVLLTLPALAGQDAGYERGHTDQGSRTPCPGHLHPTSTMLWTTALDDRYAYVTRLSEPNAGSMQAGIVRVGR